MWALTWAQMLQAVVLRIASLPAWAVRLPQFRSRHGEHALARIEAGDVLGGAENFRGLDGHQPGAASDIEQTMPRLQSVPLLHPTPVTRAAAQEAPVDDGIVMFRTLVKEAVNKLGFRRGRGVAVSERRVR